MIVISSIIIVVIFLFLLCIQVKIKRPIIAVLIGVVVSILSFIAFIILLLIFSAQKSILLPLLVAFYVSIITFLILWNIIKTKKVYLILAVPGICILTAMAVIWYDYHIHEIPTISEESSLWKYRSFEEDNIFCAAPSASQRRQFYDNGMNLKLVPIGREAFVFFVNKKNIVDNVTIENIQGIYSGRIINWRELKGSNQKIKAFQRPENSGSQTMLEKIMGNILIMEPRRENISTGMGGIIDRVAAYRNFSNAIGYSFLFYSTEMVNNDQIKLLSIEGIYPSRETIQNGRYPFSDDFYAIYIDTDDKNENIEPFIEWILSEQGQELVSKTGYIPVKR